MKALRSLHGHWLLCTFAVLVSSVSAEVPRETRELVERVGRDVAFLVDDIAAEELASLATTTDDRAAIKTYYDSYIHSLSELEAIHAEVPAPLTGRTRTGLSDAKRVVAMRDRTRALLRAKASAQRAAHAKQLSLLERILTVPSLEQIEDDALRESVQRILTDNRRRVHRANSERHREGVENYFGLHPYLPDLVTSMPSYISAVESAEDSEAFRSQIDRWRAAYNIELDALIRQSQLTELADSPLLKTEHAGIFLGDDFGREREAAFARVGKVWASWFNLNEEYMTQFFRFLNAVDPTGVLAIEARRSFEAAYAEPLYEQEFVDDFGSWMAEQPIAVLPPESKELAAWILSQYEASRSQWRSQIFHLQVDDKRQYGKAGHPDSNRPRISKLKDAWRSRHVEVVEQLMNLVPEPEHESWSQKWHMYAARNGIDLDSKEVSSDRTPGQ
jgi:hypothetical protein